MNNRIVAFIGPKESGKTEAAKALLGLKFQIVSFASPIRKMLAALGVPREHLAPDADKNVPIDVLCGKTFREAAQTLGTEWGRDMIGNDIWVRSAMAQLMDGKLYVFDDMRMVNEAVAVQDAGGMIIRIIRPGYRSGEHLSERQHEYITPDYTIINDSTVERLRHKALGVVGPYIEGWFR
jgi:hypothetical protein